ncbi:MAG: Zn-ribbon domain-containing OB-fold protein [Actinomycetota bacterium]
MSFVHSSIDIGFPYTHSTGPLVGGALAALSGGVILGARCTSCESVNVPAREWCERCAGSSGELVEVGPGGQVTMAVRAHEPTPLSPLPVPFSWVLVRLDGADTDLIHVAGADVAPGTRVRAVWSRDRIGSIRDLESFEPGEPPEEQGVPRARDERTNEIFERNVSLPYSLSAGRLMSRFFDCIRLDRTIHGVRCTSCRMVLVPPTIACPRCWAATEDWVAVSDRGTVTTFVLVNVPFHGQQMKLPYVLARVLLDGADTSLLHILDVEPSDARMGMRVEAVWREERTGFLNDDIVAFRATGEPDTPVESFIDRL